MAGLRRRDVRTQGAAPLVVAPSRRARTANGLLCRRWLAALVLAGEPAFRAPAFAAPALAAPALAVPAFAVAAPGRDREPFLGVLARPSRMRRASAVVRAPCLA